MNNPQTHKETKCMAYSLQRAEHFKPELISDVSEVVGMLGDLCIAYFRFVLTKGSNSSSALSSKSSNRLKFIVLRGLDTVLNVFHHVMFYTKNTEATHYHCQKAFYLYVEFVDQISEDEKSFLQLTTKDATSYVYKKSIFEIEGQLKTANERVSDTTRAKLDAIHEFVHLYRTLLVHWVSNDLNNESALASLEVLFRSLKIQDVAHIKALTAVLERVQCYVPDVVQFHQIATLMNLKKTEEVRGKQTKFISEEWMDRVRDTPQQFVDWLCE